MSIEKLRQVVALPYLTGDLSGIGGVLKSTPEDFIVEEIPLYLPTGEGEHVYLTFEKRGIDTFKAIHRISAALGIKSKQVGYAGLKDAQAVTRQTVSIFGVDPVSVSALDLPGIKVLQVSRHRNKLKMGHLAGNRFCIRVREVSPDAVELGCATLKRLAATGVPNYYGPQRFGLRMNTHCLGWHLLKRNDTALLQDLLGKPHLDENVQVQASRRAFDAGEFEQALKLWPSMLRAERRVLENYVQNRDAGRAVARLDKRLTRLFISAFQSYLFNQLLAQRIETLNKIELGDVAYIHHKRASFVVEAVANEQPRVDDFEISPAGPLFGTRYLAAEHKPGEREMMVLAESGITLDDFKKAGVKMDGARRPYRIPLGDFEASWDDGVVVRFSLPPGAYATTVLREVMKNEG